MPAETFPIPGFERIGLRVISGVVTARDRGGMIVTGRRAEPRWAGSFTTDKLTRDDWADLVALLDDCVDRNLRVDFIHPLFKVPRSYTLDTWPLAADPVLVAVTDRRHIVVSDLTVGLVLKRGDRLTLIQDELRCYRKIAVDTVVTSAIAQTLQLTPRIPAGLFAAGSIVRFKYPPIRLAIVPDSYQAEE
ncbi:MAG TPA: hypothetical protein VL133_05225, partial [Devosia sp.]|nr:hypothetical protein [Devosia sp.]